MWRAAGGGGGGGGGALGVAEEQLRGRIAEELLDPASSWELWGGGGGGGGGGVLIAGLLRGLP